MAESLREFAFTLTAMIPKGLAVTARSLQSVALQGEALMKVNAGAGGSHPYGQGRNKVGGAPAVVSGDLRRSITHQQDGLGWRIGPSSIPHTKYGSRSGKTRRGSHKGSATCGEIGYYLENGLEGSGPPYPFVQPTVAGIQNAVEPAFLVTFNSESW